MFYNINALSLHRVFHGIRFKVNKRRLVVVMTTFLFYNALTSIVRRNEISIRKSCTFAKKQTVYEIL
jgi:hypothetical protein